VCTVLSNLDMGKYGARFRALPVNGAVKRRTTNPQRKTT
jgi:hypothetical protein